MDFVILENFCRNLVEGLIATEIADWNTKKGKSGNNLTYVVFDPKMEGFFVKKVE